MVVICTCEYSTCILNGIRFIIFIVQTLISGFLFMGVMDRGANLFFGTGSHMSCTMSHFRTTLLLLKAKDNILRVLIICYKVA